jgi:hypothetical protein
LEREEGVRRTYRGRGVLELPKDRPAIDVMKKNVEFVGLIRKPAIVDKYITNPTAALRFIGHPNGRAVRRGLVN